MAKEIERKFLVRNDGWKKDVLLKKINIKQGYLTKTEHSTVRIRVTDDEARLTVKGPRKGLTRDEFEYVIPVEDGRQLIQMSVTPVVSKTRYYVRDGVQQVWEIDVFRGLNKGLVMAEIELQSEKQIVKHPLWAGKEVSRDKKYTNSYLAEHKVPKR